MSTYQPHDIILARAFLKLVSATSIFLPQVLNLWLCLSFYTSYLNTTVRADSIEIQVHRDILLRAPKILR